MASIRKKGRGYEARVKVFGFARSKSFESLHAARRWAREVELKLNQEHHQAKRPIKAITLTEALKRYTAEALPKLKGATQEYSRIALLARTPLAKMRIDAISPADVRSYRDELLAAGNSGATVRLKLALLSRVYSTATKEWGYQLNNPVALIAKPAAGRARNRRLEDGEEQRLLKAAAQCRNPHLAPLVAFAIESGMRRGEILSMTWSAVDLMKSVITLIHTKNGHARWVPLSSAGRVIIQGQWDRGAERPFPVSASLLENAWEHLIKRAQITNLRFHDLRHEALSRWAHRLNGDVFKLSLISGHRTLQMAQRYVHPIQSELLAQSAS